MHRTGLLALPLLLSSLALASPQVNTGTLSGLPACAQDAASAALVSSGCPLTDTSCICSSTAFINAITNTVTQSCSPADVATAVEFGRTICGPALAAGAGSSPSSTQASSPSTEAAATAPPTSTDTDTDADSYGASTTAIPVTLTSVTSIPDASMTMSTTSWVSTSTMPANNATAMMTSLCSSPTLVAPSTGTNANPATYTGAAVTVTGTTGQGLLAVLIGLAGALALF
ncbi:hypothetical protein A1O1_04734 [Capronia coronata CBS 617.96]|uniref:CFEM domain-containing protein n=1 Tax=Capronia coronata CBS 617.96 TaxID=1182541 RepID=W9Y4R0_9EURO|nr:uncharacterized protein A1O1_04734 [Capronia coronata CBS 617.96]EXJ87807.1 hypothetical protein A1O1_04734 [Capronia coronata CBS 617.96]